VGVATYVERAETGRENHGCGVVLQHPPQLRFCTVTIVGTLDKSLEVGGSRYRRRIGLGHCVV